VFLTLIHFDSASTRLGSGAAATGSACKLKLVVVLGVAGAPVQVHREAGEVLHEVVVDRASCMQLGCEFVSYSGETRMVARRGPSRTLHVHDACR
jgi:hypothetical protein